jgi:hypothetical protein
MCVHVDPRTKSETKSMFIDLNPILVLVSPETYSLMTTLNQVFGWSELKCKRREAPRLGARLHVEWARMGNFAMGDRNDDKWGTSINKRETYSGEIVTKVSSVRPLRRTQALRKAITALLRWTNTHFRSVSRN